MGIDEPEVARITWRDLAAREEGQLRFPESRLVDRAGYNEGQGWGFDHLLRSAMSQAHWTVDAEPAEVEGWFSQQLTARGWTVHRRHRSADLDADFYRKGVAGFILRLWQEDEATHYDFTFSDSSRATS